jgi:hypothetical protein
MAWIGMELTPSRPSIGGKMKNDSFKRESIQRQMLDAVRTCQAGVMDTFELEFNNSPNWQSVRSRLLRSFGDRGLSGRIIEILDFEFGEGQK